MTLRLLFLLTVFWPLKLLAEDVPDFGFVNETSLADDTSSTALPTTTSSESTSSVSMKSSSRPRLAFGKDLHCPSVENAVSTCPKDTNWVYYVCCGGADMYCCEHIQTWILTALAAVACLLALLVVACCVRELDDGSITGNPYPLVFHYGLHLAVGLTPREAQIPEHLLAVSKIAKSYLEPKMDESDFMMGILELFNPEQMAGGCASIGHPLAPSGCNQTVPPEFGLGLNKYSIALSVCVLGDSGTFKDAKKIIKLLPRVIDWENGPMG